MIEVDLKVKQAMLFFLSIKLSLNLSRRKDNQKWGSMM